ncbi:5-formyltetrahydrofolate cyclo-ligase [hydrothermal vent metagenome]|uniref:5-formyltetrahydrofolate cyclo-ligase n=1 Tax=hydrothermal vent metagenome TaxID=652676 RepID=A0A1W1CG64_9ZZZZ
MNKKEFRESCISRLKRSNSIMNYRADKIVSQKLYDYIKKSGSRVVMLYIPLKIEINIIGLIIRLRKEKVTLFVPFMVGKSFRLVKYRLPIKVKKFGVKEPNISNNFYKRIDLAIVPIIGMDKSFRRVGFGKGFYDRFFEKHGDTISSILFVGRKSCICSEIITDDYDVEGDFYITPNRVFDKNSFK